MKQGIAIFVCAGVALSLAACGGGSDAETTDATSDVSVSQSMGESSTTAVTESTPGEPTTPPTGTESQTTEPQTSGAPTTDGPPIVIGAQDFGESAILAEVYGQALSGAGYTVEQQALGGFRDLEFTAFESGDINFAPEYAASALDFLQPGTATPDITETAVDLAAALMEKNLTILDPSPAVDSNSFVVTAETAANLSAQKVSALTEDMTLGGPTDCPDNASCIPGLKSVYDIDLSANFVPLDGGGPLTVAALEGGEIDVAILFSTNGVIADKGWVVLEDDKGLINADNIVPVMSTELTETYGADFEAVVNKVSSSLDTAQLTELNRQYDVDKADAKDIAAKWLADNGLAG